MASIYFIRLNLFACLFFDFSALAHSILGFGLMLLCFFIRLSLLPCSSSVRREIRNDYLGLCYHGQLDPSQNQATKIEPVKKKIPKIYGVERERVYFAVTSVIIDFIKVIFFKCANIICHGLVYDQSQKQPQTL